MSSGYFDLVKDLGYYLIGGDVVCFGFICEADAVTQNIVAYGADIFGDYVAALMQECI